MVLSELLRLHTTVSATPFIGRFDSLPLANSQSIRQAALTRLTTGRMDNTNGKGPDVIALVGSASS